MSRVIDPKVEKSARELLELAIQGHIQQLANHIESSVREEEYRQVIELCVVAAAYIAVDASGRWPTEADLRQIARNGVRGETRLDLDQEQIYQYLSGAALGFKPLAEALGSDEAAATMPILITGSMLFTFRPRGVDWWEYLDQIWNATLSTGLRSSKHALNRRGDPGDLVDGPDLLDHDVGLQLVAVAAPVPDPLAGPAGAIERDGVVVPAVFWPDIRPRCPVEVATRSLEPVRTGIAPAERLLQHVMQLIERHRAGDLEPPPYWRIGAAQARTQDVYPACRDYGQRGRLLFGVGPGADSVQVPPAWRLMVRLPWDES
jgi:hypothetical protein